MFFGEPYTDCHHTSLDSEECPCIISVFRICTTLMYKLSWKKRWVRVQFILAIYVYRQAYVYIFTDMYMATFLTDI